MRWFRYSGKIFHMNHRILNTSSKLYFFDSVQLFHSRHNHVKMLHVRPGEDGQNGQNAQLRVKLGVKEDIDSVSMAMIVTPKVSRHSN